MNIFFSSFSFIFFFFKRFTDYINSGIVFSSCDNECYYQKNTNNR